ncbi:hypothetical protein chiPu_0014663 [Chiloscyllium punctatum]|uniref:TFIIS central domain-containing protein n=1 Tax=Chiloscyllium punctatum TaxID=137246 RepID=A0A401T0M0_CHIPU|nr:hypothetical protein [Chiloscyllium punctatum]
MTSPSPPPAPPMRLALQIMCPRGGKESARGGATVKVYKSSVIQLLKACDPDIQPGLLQCLEDTSERVTWNNSLSGNSGSVLIHKGQHFEAKFSCSNELDQCQKDQELEEVPCKQPDFCSDQAIVRKQHVVRRQRNNQSSTVPTTRIAIPQLSSEEIRIIVYTSFKDILIHRLQETSDLNLNENAVRAVSADIEKELFKLFYCTNTRYKNKYRSLMFNLKDPKNTVLQGDITPQCLVLMSPTELASLELMEWRKREYKHDTSPKSFGHAELSVSEKNSIIDTTHQHRSHLLDPNCQICSAPLAAPVKSRVRRAKESCMASNLLNLAPDISVDERTLLESKCVSQMENTAGLPNPTKYPAAFKRFHPQTHAVWKGFIQMSNMKQFLVKAYPVLGLTDHLTKVQTITITR